ncbi:MAG: quinol:cytochrome C oxidoreductase [Ignavibacteriales bacterium]|nr:quinol:cytochrome C oxidoreductase [Ignavibacteriales bacterium]
MVDAHFAIYAYLLSYVFLVTIAIGSLFIFALEYVAGAEWSTPFRRIVEFFASLAPVLLLLIIPLLLNIGTLFHWAHPEVVASDKILQAKSPFLNTPFFIVRTVGCVLLWSLFYFLLSRNSKKQDESKDQSLTTKNIRISAIFIPVFAITLTMTSIDWMMSLEPHWFSTIYGVYFFAGSMLAGLAAATFAAVVLLEKGYLHPSLTDEHLYSLGSLLFAFINFWGYIAFSQYMLIWYANLPEETFWFLSRWEGGWIFISLALIVVHFLVPYAVLLSQPAKVDPKRLKFAALWILFAHMVDLYWLIMPSVHAEKFSILSIILQFAFPTAAVGVVILVFYYNSKKYNLTPVGDPKLQKGLNFKL